MKLLYREVHISKQERLQFFYLFQLSIICILSYYPVKAQQAVMNSNIQPAAIADSLPLRLIEFTGRPSNDIISFKWITTGEININRFELEKSIDGTTFTTINKQTAKGINTNTDNYKAEDFKPLQGINYYRLKFIRNDARFSYSKIIKVKF